MGRSTTREVWTPVLMLPAKAGEYDQVDAFDLGADDYLTKPFSFIVLIARLRALLRRGAPERPVILRWRSCAGPGAAPRHPCRHRSVAHPREYGVLEFLLRHTGTVVTKPEILRGVWDAHYEGDDNVVEVSVAYLRRKLDTPFGGQSIETVSGVGYRLSAENC